MAAKKKSSKGSGGLAKSIERIKAFMHENDAGVLVENLSEGTAGDEIDVLASKRGVRIPADLRELWTIHDGQEDELNGFLGSLDLLSHSEAIRRRTDILNFVKFCREDPDSWEEAGVTKAEVMSDQWLPFGMRDSDSLVVSGESGRVFECGKDSPPLHFAADSVTAWFAKYAADIDAGLYEVEEGFGDVYLQILSADEVKERVQARQAEEELPKIQKALKAAFRDESNDVEDVEVAIGRVDRAQVHVTIKRKSPFALRDEGDRVAALRSVLEANALTLFSRHSLRESKLVTDYFVPLSFALEESVIAQVKRELDLDAYVPEGEAQQLTKKQQADLHGKGSFLTLAQDDQDKQAWRVAGRNPIFGRVFSDTWQMRCLVPLRAPQGEKGLATLNEWNFEPGRVARLCVFDDQIAVATGTLLRDNISGAEAEAAYWDLSGLIDDVAARGKGAPTPSPAVETALSRKAKACLSSLSD